MSVIIRLQGLPWSASAMNIRHFFSGLNIPAGGVHIIGGEGGDAFIAFSSDDDARMAMKMNLCPLNGTPVQLFLSSKSEMQSVIDAARSGTATTSALSAPSTANTSTPAATGMGGGTGGHQSSVHNMSGGYTGMQGMSQNNQYGPVGGGFQNMQQRGDMSGGGGMGVGGKSEWQPMPGMMGAGGSDGGGQFNSNQRSMMGGDDNTNRYPGYPDNRQHLNMQQGAHVMGNQGQMAQGHMGMPGIGDRQHLGMDPSGQGDPMGQGRGRLGDDMRAGNMGSGMNQKMGQFGGAENRDKAPGVMAGQMDMDIDPDPIKQGMSGGMMGLPRNRGMNDPMTRLGFQGAAEVQGGDLMKERLGNQVMPGPPTSGSPGLGLGGSLRSPWVGDNIKEGGSFSDKQTPINPDRKVEPGDMAQEPSFRRDRPNRVNRFAEVPEHPVQDPFNQPKRSNELDFERDMRFPNRFHDGPKDQMDNMPPGRGFAERPPGERRGPIGDDGMPSTRYPPDDDQFQEEGRFPMGRGGPNDRRPPPIRYMPDDMRPMGDESRMPPNDRGRFSNDERGLGPTDGGRYPPHADRFPDHDRRFPPDQRFMGNDRNFPPSNDRPYPGDDRRPPPGEGRFMPDDRPGMWQGERQRPDDMMGRRPGDNPFPLDDPRHREREQESRREAFERNRHGPGGEWPPNDAMHGGRMDHQGRQGNEDMGGKPFPPERRGFSGERHGGPGFREDERDFNGPPGRMEGRPDGGPPRWSRGESGNMDRPEMGGRGPFPPGNHDGPMVRPDRGPMPNAPPMDNEGPSDMDQRISHGMYGNRRPGMPPNHGRGEGPTEGELGEGPHDFDNRAMGPRGGGMMMGERPPRGRGDPFNRGRPGTMPMARGRGMEMDRHFEEGGPPRQDVDNRTMAGDRFAAGPNQGPPQSDLGPRPGMGKSLLGDGPQELVPGRESADRNKPNESRSDTSWRDSDSRYSRRGSRDKDRRYDDRRGRDRDERDRYRSRYDRDRERDRDRDRRRSRSRSRNRGSSRDRDRYSRDRSARDNTFKPESDSSRSSSARKPDERPTRFLHVKNMPLTISYRDLRRFFSPLEIPFDGIKLINDKGGNRNGEAFIYFHRLDDAVTAHKKNGERTEGKVVLITFTTESEFNKAVDSYLPVMEKRESASVLDKRVPVSAIPMPPEPRNTNASNKPRFIVQLNNLPQTITRQDINLFFNTIKIDKEGEAAYIEFDNNGVATGNGFVEFKTDIDYKKALTHSGSLIGTSKIMVMPGKAEEADKLKAVQGEMFQRAALRSLNKTSPAQSQKPGLMGIRPKAPTGPPQQTATPLVPTTAKPASTTPGKEESSSHDTVCVHIQGLPLLATPRDIKDFFGDCQIALRGINIAHDSQGKPLGEGFVEFKFLSDFEKALKKDKTSMGRHIVAVKPIGKKEMRDKLENAKQQGATPRSLINTTPPTSLNNQSKPPTPLAQQSPQANAKPLITPTSPSTSQAAPQGQAHGPSDNHPSLSNNLQNQSISRPPGPSNNSDLKQPGPNPNPANPRGPAPEMGKSQGPVMPLLQTPQPQVTMPGGGKTFPPGVLNSNWYYVRCQNFPPDISIGEIMNFFKTFRPLGESIRLHYSSEGHPTGNAVVGFASGEEATRALQCLNMRVCRHNVVTLHPA